MALVRQVSLVFALMTNAFLAAPIRKHSHSASIAPNGYIESSAPIRRAASPSGPMHTSNVDAHGKIVGEAVASNGDLADDGWTTQEGSMLRTRAISAKAVSSNPDDFNPNDFEKICDWQGRRRIDACAASKIRQESLRIGFVGNSFTYYNNLPHIVQLFLGGSEDIYVKAVLHGGSNLKKTFDEGANPCDEKYIHCDLVLNVTALVENESLDVLVLQDNSRGPVSDTTRERGLETLENDYVPLMKRQPKVPFIVLYQTYGYEKTKDAEYNFADFTEELISGYEAYESLLSASGLDVQVARVGEAVKKVHSEAYDVWSHFYVEDGYHPSPELTLLAASHVASAIAKQFDRSLQFAHVWPCQMNCHPKSLSTVCGGPFRKKTCQSDIETTFSIAGPENAEYIDGKHCSCPLH